jgi:hypothetical protein
LVDLAKLKADGTHANAELMRGGGQSPTADDRLQSLKRAQAGKQTAARHISVFLRTGPRKSAFYG